VLISQFFKEIRSGKVKVRIMFSHNIHVPVNLTPDKRDKAYFLLYYQFIKHAFGLQFMPDYEYGCNLRIFFDKFPETHKKIIEFKNFIYRLQNQDNFNFIDSQRGINILKPKFVLKLENITEVNSKKHVLMQCLDIVLGAMAFRLNNLHLEKIPGTKNRGKRTVAKEELYKHIRNEICKIRPRFNIGNTTGKDENWENLWNHPYRHWLFKPRDFEIDGTKSKKKQKNTPLDLH